MGLSCCVSLAECKYCDIYSLCNCDNSVELGRHFHRL